MKASDIFAGLRPLPVEREDDWGSENSSIVSSEALAYSWIVESLESWSIVVSLTVEVSSSIGGVSEG